MCQYETLVLTMETEAMGNYIKQWEENKRNNRLTELPEELRKLRRLHHKVTECCDMFDGPCACGAWHHPDWWLERLINFTSSQLQKPTTNEETPSMNSESRRLSAVDLKTHIEAAETVIKEAQALKCTEEKAFHHALIQEAMEGDDPLLVAVAAAIHIHNRKREKVKDLLDPLLPDIAKLCEGPVTELPCKIEDLGYYLEGKYREIEQRQRDRNWPAALKAMHITSIVTDIIFRMTRYDCCDNGYFYRFS